MEIIRHALDAHDHHDYGRADHAHGSECTAVIPIRTDRRTLAKTRWRGVAKDGREFGFDLTKPLQHGAIIFENETARYVLEQAPEPVFRVAVTDPTTAARVGWMIGNLHFPAQVRDGAIFVEADLAVRQMLERERIAFVETEAVFQPLLAGAGHSHGGHGHHHH